ncbi:mandelate racemase/muconate lactonizing enzyme family protein [Actinomadura sp. NPDC047616]|uniref:mandelate racemase/muconate lactonizing enzyme family protein n=1 Tax=Actinomadura sp. NPDC047616 TaxID=3155914 RepID=UPI0033EC5F47
MTRISEITAITVRVPLTRPVSLATRRVTERVYTLVRVINDAGLHGIGFCYAGYGGSDLTTSTVIDVLAPLLIGEDHHRTAWLWHKMRNADVPLTGAGHAARALSALDIALWDLNARDAGQPLHRHIGAYAATHVDAYRAGGYYGEDDDDDALLAEVSRNVAAGARAVKIKVGRFDIDRERRRVLAVRDAIGPGVSLMLDANAAWDTVGDALPYARAYASADPLFIEDPLPAHDLRGALRLRDLSGVAISLGETFTSVHEFNAIVTDGICDDLQVDGTSCGGVSGFLRIADIAEAGGAKVHAHWFPELHVHLAARLAAPGPVETFPDDSAVNFSRLTTAAPAWEAGRIRLPTEPGIGFEFDEDAIAAYSDTPWKSVRG